MSALQPELFDQKAPAVSTGELAEMVAMLTGRDWRTAADLGAHDEKDKRKLRAIARASAGEIISGPKGYRLTQGLWIGSAEALHTGCNARVFYSPTFVISPFSGRFSSNRLSLVKRPSF